MITIELKEISGWKKLKQLGLLEIWKSQTKYLVCQHYLYKYHFFDTYDECMNKAKKLYNLYENN